jgi:hypothetical protein
VYKDLSHTQDVIGFVIHVNNRAYVGGLSIPVEKRTESIGFVQTVFRRETEEAAFEVQVQIIGDFSTTVDFRNRKGTTAETGSLAQGWEDKQAE